VQRRANADLAEKNNELADERAKVEQRFKLAQKAIAKLHTGVSEDMLLKSDQFKELRTQLLKDAAGFYGDLEKMLEGEADPKSRRLLAEGYFQLAQLTLQIGSRTEALALHHKALAVRRELAAAAGADVETRLDVARSLGAIAGVLVLTGDADGALACLAEQQVVAARLKAESPTEAVQAVLGQSFSYASFVFLSLGKAEDALAANDKAVAILRELVAANTAASEPQHDLARCLITRGWVLFEMGRWVAESAPEDDARHILEKLARDNPGVMQFKYSLGRAYIQMGDSLFDEKKPAEALASAEKGRAILQQLADTHPAAALIQFMLATSHTDIGAALAKMGQPAEAMASQRRALAILEKLVEANPTDFFAQCGLAWSEDEIGELMAQEGGRGRRWSFWKRRGHGCANRPRPTAPLTPVWCRRDWQSPLRESGCFCRRRARGRRPWRPARKPWRSMKSCARTTPP
jgi:tetratricopeptide (TPR) repeat protein